jgi:hypothetical protein
VVGWAPRVEARGVHPSSSIVACSLLLSVCFTERHVAARPQPHQWPDRGGRGEGHTRRGRSRVGVQVPTLPGRETPKPCCRRAGCDPRALSRRSASRTGSLNGRARPSRMISGKSPRLTHLSPPTERRLWSRLSRPRLRGRASGDVAAVLEPASRVVFGDTILRVLASSAALQLLPYRL